MWSVLFRHGPKVLFTVAGVVGADAAYKQAKAKRLSREASAAYTQAAQAAEQDVERDQS